MLKKLLYRGRHTSATAICLIYSISIASLTSQIAVAQNVTTSTLTINPGGLTPITLGPLDPSQITQLNAPLTPTPPPPGTETRLRPVAMTAKAMDVAASANGSLWVVATDKTVWQFNGTKFVKMPTPKSATGGFRLAVSPGGICWLIASSTQRLFYWDTTNRVWGDTGQAALDVAVGADGSTWFISPEFQLKKWSGTVWDIKGRVPDVSLFRLAVDPSGNPWVTGKSGTYQFVNNVFQKWAIPAWDIAIAGDGNVWLTTGPTGYGQVYRYDGKQLVAFSGASATTISVDGVGMAYTIDENDQVYSIPVPGPVVAAQPITSPGWNWFRTPGKLECSAHSEPNDCGRTQANWVGKHEVKMKCDSGFYDPIYGGTCWKCPDDDGSGGWIRSLDPVTSSTACWRSPKETFSSAIKVKSPGWSWECPSGSFWDGYSPDGAGGSCWKCPDAYPRRTGYHIKESNACVTASNQTDTAELLSFSGCPKPDRATMGLTGARTPGRPFLDVGAGGCFACPVVVNDGTFVISLRNGVALYSQDAESTAAYTATKSLKQGCDVAFRYKASPFKEPGLGGLVGGLELVMEKKLLEYPDLMTGYLYALADGKSLTGADAKTYVTNAWDEIATNPMNSEALRAVTYLLLQGAVKKDRAKRSQNEQRLIDSFSRYILDKRVYYAQLSLDMYDAWRADMDAFESTIKKSPMKELFSPGTVPLDFKGTLLSIAASVNLPATAYLGLSAAYNMRTAQYDAALEIFDQVDAEAKPKVTTVNGQTVPDPTIETTTKTARLSKPKVPATNYFTKALDAVRGVSVASRTASFLTGVAFVEVAALIIGVVAAANLLAIETARPELQAIVSKASQPVDLPTLMSTDDGLATAMMFWGQAIGATDPELPALTTMAQSAKNWAAARSYARPKGI